MNPELQTKLFRRYPNFFRKPSGRFVQLESDSDAEQLVYSAMPFDERGIECGDGWFSLIDHLSCTCEKEIDKLILLGVVKERWPRVSQIKEKFGSLRFYVMGALPEELREQILKTSEEESRRTCEQCGALKECRSGESRITFCKDCSAMTSVEN